MSLEMKRWIIAILGILFLASLILVQYQEVLRKKAEVGEAVHVVVPASSRSCVECHEKLNPGIVAHWKGSTHAVKAIGCVECHQAETSDVDAFEHYGAVIATVVTPRDCSRCHKKEYDEFAQSHHAHGGQILHSLDNFLAESVEGSRTPFFPFNPHDPTKPGMAVQVPGRKVDKVNGLASAFTGCQQCHGSKIALRKQGGGMITWDDLNPEGKSNDELQKIIAAIVKDDDGRPMLHPSTWPNHGIGRINLDGSLGSCSACHSRHDFSPRRARQPENCGRCHLGPDHPQKEIYEESMHGVAYRDLRSEMNLDARRWVLGKDYSAAPTCATCHMSAHSRKNGQVTHDAGARISWSNRPPVSIMKPNAMERRNRMKQVCNHCHSNDYINSFYKQYDDFIVLYNEKFAKPGQAIMKALYDNDLLTANVVVKNKGKPDEKKVKTSNFDEEIEWTWFYLWHHEGRRARHGASMMAPDYAHWHGMYEVAERFYMELIPQAREVVHKAKQHPDAAFHKRAEAVERVIEQVLSRPEHRWYERDLKQLWEKARGMK